MCKKYLQYAQKDIKIHNNIWLNKNLALPEPEYFSIVYFYFFVFILFYFQLKF